MDVDVDAVVFNFGVFLNFKGSKLSLFGSWCNHFQTPNRVPPVKPFFSDKLSLEVTNWSLSSNAFKNGAFMLRNIGTPLSNA